MDILSAMAMIALLLFFPLVTAFVAKSLDRKFWIWFAIGTAFPFTGIVVLLCLPLKNKQAAHNIYPLD